VETLTTYPQKNIEMLETTKKCPSQTRCWPQACSAKTDCFWLKISYSNARCNNGEKEAIQYWLKTNRLKAMKK